MSQKRVIALPAYLNASPVALSQLFNAVDKALSSPQGRASVELAIPFGESFTLHIIRQLDEDKQYE